MNSFAINIKYILLYILGGFFLSPYVLALDVIKANIGESTLDQRIHFKKQILINALDLTKPKYGEYKIDIKKYYMNGERSFVELTKGKNINVYFSLTQERMERTAIPIRIPVRRGIVNYRLLLIKKGTENLFSDVNTLDDLKKIKVGIDTAWAAHKTLLYHDFNIAPVADYDSMFNMLARKRFKYIPRSISEIYGEIDRHPDDFYNFAVEPSLVLYIPSATYIFVSRESPRIADRLKEGLEMMVENGDLLKVFNRFFSDSIEKSDVRNRKIIYIDNPYLPSSVPVSNKNLWFSPENY